MRDFAALMMTAVTAPARYGAPAYKMLHAPMMWLTSEMSHPTTNVRMLSETRYTVPGIVILPPLDVFVSAIVILLGVYWLRTHNAGDCW